jgi:alpha-L-fucosidase
MQQFAFVQAVVPFYINFQKMQYIKRIAYTLFFFAGISFAVSAQLNCHPESCQIDQKDINLANQFNPQNCDPDKWLKAAKEAGFTYAVLTTKHHDGYALWPFKYGIGTKQYMNGRDLLKPYVDACRANGLKVGFCFSPCDWHYPGLMHPNEFDANSSKNIPPITDQADNYRNFEQFLGFVLAQMEELLTHRGKIDILWLNGMNFRGGGDMHTEQLKKQIIHT